MAHTKYQKVKKAFGHGSGTALGYIIGGSKGAKHGYKIGGWLASDGTRKTALYSRTTPRTQSLQPLRSTTMAISKRKRANSFSGNGGSKRRQTGSKKSTGFTAKSARRRSSRRSITRKKKNSLHSAVGRTSTSTTFKGQKKWMKLYKKLAQPLHLAANNSVRLSSVTSIPVSGSGRQHAGFLPNWRQAGSPLLGAEMFNDINAALTASVPPAAAAAPNQHLTRRFMVQRASVEHRIKNQTTTPVKVAIYDITPRRDLDGTTINPGAIADWNAGLNNQSIELTAVGFIDNNEFEAAQVGVTPFMSRQFTTKWKVKNVSSFMLEAGMEHLHYVNLNIGGMFDWERVKDVDLLKGISQYTMVVYSGGVVQQTGASTVSTSSVTLNIVTTSRCVVRMLEKSTTGKIQWNNLIQIPVDQQQVVNEETDVVATVNTL